MRHTRAAVDCNRALSERLLSEDRRSRAPVLRHDGRRSCKGCNFRRDALHVDFLSLCQCMLLLRLNEASTAESFETSEAWGYSTFDIGHPAQVAETSLALHDATLP